MKVKEIITVIVVGLMVVVFSSNAYAQDKNSINFDFKPRSETNALLWSLSGTIVPIYAGTKLTKNGGPGRLLLIASGVLIGPSLGYFYGDIPKRGLRGVAVRSGVIFGSFVIGGAIGLDICISLFGNSNSECNDDGWTVVGLGALFVIGHGLYDIATVKSTIQKHNLELMRKNQTSVTLMPKYFANSGAGGLELRVTF